MEVAPDPDLEVLVIVCIGGDFDLCADKQIRSQDNNKQNSTARCISKLLSQVHFIEDAYNL